MEDRVMRGGGAYLAFDLCLWKKNRRHLEIALTGTALMGNVVVY